MKLELSVIIDLKDDDIEHVKLCKEIKEILDKTYYVEEVSVEKEVEE